MSMRVLIAITSLPYCDALLQLGAEIAKLTDQIPTLLTVIHRENQRAAVAATITSAYDRLRDSAPELRTEVRLGSPSQEILQEIESGEYDLVIVGNPECRGLMARFVMDATVDRVVHHSPCPVLIAKGRIRPIRHILLCDSGARSPSLLGRFVSKVRMLVRRDVDVTVLHVMSQMSAGPGVKGTHLRANAEELIREHAPEGELLQKDMDMLRQIHIDSHPKVRHGLVVEEIVEEANTSDYDLVVIGGRTPAGWERILLDDLGDQIISQVNLPVLVLR
jgi:nucleotide-binding universal stress UspA family protein